ncbi:hypothetical protein [uncultured Victivallis sp.]|uniref:hypothetical protein n=1 Tax=uncultured Victivallis sp. TaxID=354118 RepID=UPI0025CFBEDA|nr:hypothetical protein [uncultured Victivallis sp.]
MNHIRLREFLEESPFAAYVETCWNSDHYEEFPIATGLTGCDPGGVNSQLVFYHVYTEKLKLRSAIPGRAARLALWLAGLVREDGLCRTNDGVTDHPAYASTMGDALGTALFHAELIGLNGENRKTVMDALTRLAERHPRLRFPEGAQGKTQQLRFELRVYYWMAQLSDDPVWKERFEILLANGLRNYVTPAAIDGPLLQPSLNPDWTWNYVCTGGITDQHSTNTHTPAYYCTEPNGFMFVYLHALRNSFSERRKELDDFCRNYIAGLLRNLSRGGHLASDLDGYGIHRAWYGPVLVEGLPLESAMVAAELGETALAGYCRWYIDRYIEFVKSRPTYAESGLPEAQPFGQKINIEAQFSQLATARFYASIARALAEFGEVEEIPTIEPPFFGSYAWEAQWLRISTPAYETSFAGHTCLRNIPVVPRYGDPNLGTLIGGAPLATLFGKKELFYAASFPAASLWHVEVDDHNGRRFVSCSTSPEDHTAMTVRSSTGEMLTASDFDPYDPPCNFFLGNADCLEAVWERRERQYKIDFHVHNRYYADRIELEFGMRHMAGHYCDKVTFVVPIPLVNAEFSEDGNTFLPLEQLTALPAVIRWGEQEKCLIRDLRISGGDSDRLEVKALALPQTPGNPGGVNAFSPHPTLQLRFEVTPGVMTQMHRLRCTLVFGETRSSSSPES